MARKRKPVPEKLTREEKKTLSVWHKENWPHHFHSRSVRATYLRTQVESSLDWCRSNGKEYVDYVAFIRNWIRRDMERRGYEPDRPPPLEVGQRGGEQSISVQGMFAELFGDLTRRKH